MKPAELLKHIKHDTTWQEVLPYFSTTHHGIHLAVMREPFLTYVLNGSKTIESRFSRHRIAPYNQVNAGDLVLLKKSSGSIIASFVVAHARQYELDDATLYRLRKKYGGAIAGDESFWQQQQDKRYATLLTIGTLRLHTAMSISKRDPRGWVVLQNPPLNARQV
jgi:hypothetical protein